MNASDVSLEETGRTTWNTPSAQYQEGRRLGSELWGAWVEVRRFEGEETLEGM